jgi:acyl-CoA thioester hydrolase
MSSNQPAENDFAVTIQVQPADIDDLGHVNNVVYVRWVQDVATAHWNSLTSPEAQLKYAWVVLRHEIDYVNPALNNETILATTWVGESNGPRSDRYVHLSNKVTGKLLAKAKTTWCLLDGLTLRPRRVPAEIIALLRQGRV